MSNQKQTCRVCGSPYTPCTNQRGDSVVFNWKAVACSAECGTKYFQKIEESRKPKQKLSLKTRAIRANDSAEAPATSNESLANSNPE